MFIRVRMGSLMGVLGSLVLFAFAGFYSGGPRCVRVHSDSRGFTLARLGIVGFIRLCVCHSGAPSGFWVHSGVRRFTPARLAVVGVRVGYLWRARGVVGFIRVRIGSLGRAIGSLGSFGFTWVLSGPPRSRRVHSRSRSFTREGLGVFGFIRVRVGRA